MPALDEAQGEETACDDGRSQYELAARAGSPSSMVCTMLTARTECVRVAWL